VHGGPHGVRDYWGYDREIQHLASRGFAVFQINYRGSGGYGREFLKSGFNHWGDTMQDDLTDGVNWLVDQGIADRKKLCIYGASYGGYAAMMSSAREPDLYKCAVGYVGVYDVDSFTTVGNIPGYRAGSAYLKEVIPSDPAIRDAFSPTMQASKIKAEVFLVHGKKDKQAHFNNYEILTKKFDDLNKPYKSLVKFDEEHGFYKTENQIELAIELEEFFTQHIGPSN
jgi:dipeptidyl aminopeptidase/acylaminoacyl peptidase